jgi:raffinose/stachyose/melibiose transport system permease protein
MQQQSPVARAEADPVSSTARPSTGSVSWLARRGLIYAPLIVWALVTLYPFSFIVLTSFRSLDDLYARPFSLPDVWHFSNYADAWRIAQIPRLAVNSAIVAVSSTALILLVATPAAFALSRFSFRLKPFLWGYILLGLFVPEVTRLVPLVIVAGKLHLSDSLWGLATIYAAAGIPFNVFLVASFMHAIPSELEEAAVVDGAGTWRVFREVIVPLSRPALLTAATFHLLYTWNEFIIARLLISTPTNRTLPLGMAQLLNQFATNLPGFAAAMVMALIPAVAAFVLLQRHVIRGLTEGALRG